MFVPLIWNCYTFLCTSSGMGFSDCSGTAVMLPVTLVCILLILTLATSTAVLGTCLLRLRRKYSKHSDNNEKNSTCPSKNVQCKNDELSDTVMDVNGVNQTKSCNRRKNNVSLAANSIAKSCREVNCKKNVAYGDDAVQHKEDRKRGSKESKSNKNKMLGSVNVECKQNEAYGGVGAGYKVIREELLLLCKRCLDHQMCLSHPMRYTKVAKCKQTRMFVVTEMTYTYIMLVELTFLYCLQFFLHCCHYLVEISSVPSSTYVYLGLVGIRLYDYIHFFLMFK